MITSINQEEMRIMTGKTTKIMY